jgi:hypothetical protein
LADIWYIYFCVCMCINLFSLGFFFLAERVTCLKSFLIFFLYLLIHIFNVYYRDCTNPFVIIKINFNNVTLIIYRNMRILLTLYTPYFVDVTNYIFICCIRFGIFYHYRDFYTLSFNLSIRIQWFIHYWHSIIVVCIYPHQHALSFQITSCCCLAFFHFKLGTPFRFL